MEKCNFSFGEISLANHLLSRKKPFHLLNGRWASFWLIRKPSWLAITLQRLQPRFRALQESKNVLPYITKGTIEDNLCFLTGWPKIQLAHHPRRTDKDNKPSWQEDKNHLYIITGRQRRTTCTYSQKEKDILRWEQRNTTCTSPKED